ncbi:hypothetical protein NDU88_005073 [Pleurodeles waltl]|uniref:Uncharacterized protein n=1 Tax=Pleurodeles waltl TaxID=8319 RepID=A0AAV7TTT4_PLEWA|nr:hypothetical protein NDU88_005073 [Pleurodeles waltl]
MKQQSSPTWNRGLENTTPLAKLKRRGNCNPVAKLSGRLWWSSGYVSLLLQGLGKQEDMTRRLKDRPGGVLHFIIPQKNNRSGVRVLHVTTVRIDYGLKTTEALGPCINDMERIYEVALARVGSCQAR